MKDPSNTPMMPVEVEFSVFPPGERYSYAFSKKLTTWQSYEKGSLAAGTYTDVKMVVHNTAGAIGIEHFNDITIESNKASEPIIIIKPDSIKIAPDGGAHSEGDTMKLEVEYFYDDVTNNDVIANDFWMTELILCAKELNNQIVIETIIDPISINNGLNMALIDGIKPETEYEIYISYKWDSNTNPQTQDKDYIVYLNKTITPCYSDVTEPQITNVEARNTEPEHITPDGGLKNGEIEVTWEIEDIHDSITGIIVELESKDGDQQSQISGTLPKETREYAFTGLEEASFEVVVKIEYIVNVGTQESIEKVSSVDLTSIATKEVPGVKHDPSRDVYNEKKQTLTMFVEIDNRFGLVEQNKYTIFNLRDSNGNYIDHKAVHNSPNSSGELDLKVYEFEIKFSDILPGEYYLEVIIQLTALSEIYTFILETQEYLASESHVGLIVTISIIGTFMLLLLIYFLYDKYRKNVIWKTDSVEEFSNETPKNLTIKLELLSLTKVLDQVSISILCDDKTYDEVKKPEKKEMLTGREVLKIPNILLNENHDYKRVILLPTLKNSAKINVVAPKKRVRKSSPFRLKPHYEEHTLNTKIKDETIEKSPKTLPKKKILKYDKDGHGKYLTIRKGLKTKYITGGKYELHIIHSSNINEDESSITTRELLTNIVITFKKLS